MAAQPDLDNAVYLSALSRAFKTVGWQSSMERATEVCADFLYVGAQTEATDPSYLSDLGITHVFNCAAEYVQTGPSFYSDDITYTEVCAEDDEDYDMLGKHFLTAYDFFQQARENGGRVFIHCVGGFNRSVVLAVAYSMLFHQIDPITAALPIREKRILALTNEFFQEQLIQFARVNNLLPSSQTLQKYLNNE